MTNLFVYGTLMFGEVAARVVEGAYARTPAELQGFVRRKVKGAVYPGIHPSAGGAVSGWVWRDVTEGDLRRLDSFEGDAYERVSVTVRRPSGASVAADVYQIRASFRQALEEEDWDAATFERRDLARFLAQHLGLGGGDGPG